MFVRILLRGVLLMSVYAVSFAKINYIISSDNLIQFSML